MDDAERYRWLRNKLVAVDFTGPEPVLHFALPGVARVSANLDRTIDDAAGPSMTHACSWESVATRAIALLNAAHWELITTNRAPSLRESIKEFMDEPQPVGVDPPA